MLRMVINLDRSPDRWMSTRSQLEKIGISAERVPAVDGKNLAPPLYRKKSSLNLGCPRDLLPGEIGCYLSHLNCWKKLLQSNEKFALIMEDDILISPRAAAYMNNADWIPSGCHLIQLHGDKKASAMVKRRTLKLAKTGDELVRLIRPTPVLTQAYIISREAAIYAINNSKTIDAPVDDFFASPYFNFIENFNIWRLNPCVVTGNQSESSTIGNRQSIRTNIPLSMFLKRKLIKLKYKINLLNCKRKILFFK